MSQKTPAVFAELLGRSRSGVPLFWKCQPAALRQMARTRKALDMPYHFDAATGRWTWPDGDEPKPPQRASTLAEAEARMLAGKKAVPVDDDPPENVPEAISEGDARDLAAAKLGISGKTGDKLAAVVDAIDAAEALRQTG